MLRVLSHVDTTMRDNVTAMLDPGDGRLSHRGPTKQLNVLIAES
jgi:hypothetical protein